MVRKILYVDDDIDSRMIVSAYLRNLGYQVATADEAGAALRLMRRNRPDAVVLDTNLIDMDGPQLLERLEREQPGVPIILYSEMSPHSKKIANLLAGGAHQFVSKNQPLEHLVRALQAFFHPVH